MKLIFLMLLTLSSAFAMELKISKMKAEEGMERSFVLKTNLSRKVLLDCQSFIQGISIGERSEGDFYMLEPQECEDLYQRIDSSLDHRQKHCVDLDEVFNSDYPCH